jgi:predicted Zn finger-like uncharacterized protein
MATKPYTLTCPDCETVFTIDLSPEELGDDGDTITCPGCDLDQEWEYDEEAGTLTLIPDEDFDETDLTDDDLEEEDADED